VADAEAGFADGFHERLRALLDRHRELGQLGYDEARRLGADAAGAAVAPVLWRAVVGETWDTTTTTEFMNVSRQALHQRVRKGTILALPGRGTRHFPVWQFDTVRRDVWPVVPKILAAFHDADIDDPFVVASWASSRQPELDASPEGWIVHGNNPDTVLEVAERTARDLAA
jgi:hypothetical protein